MDALVGDGEAAGELGDGAVEHVRVAQLGHEDDVRRRRRSSARRCARRAWPRRTTGSGSSGSARRPGTRSRRARWAWFGAGGCAPGMRCSRSAIARSLMPYRRAASARSSIESDDHPAGSAGPGAVLARAPTRRTSPRRPARGGCVGRCLVRHLGIVDLATPLGFRRAHLAAPVHPAAPRTRPPGPGAGLLDGPARRRRGRARRDALRLRHHAVRRHPPGPRRHLRRVRHPRPGVARRRPHGPVRVQRHRRRRPAAGARRGARHRLARPGRRADRSSTPRT